MFIYLTKNIATSKCKFRNNSDNINMYMKQANFGFI